jgi:hypothetical protein
VNRYFELIFDGKGRFDMICEYSSDWGLSAFNDAPHYFAYTSPIRENWYIYSDHPISDQVKTDAINRLSQGDLLWNELDMTKADNPISQRKPAMKGRKRR